MDDQSTLSTKLANGNAELEVVEGTVTLKETVTSTFQKEDLIQNIANLTNKIEENDKAVDQTRANIVALEQHTAILKQSRENFRELLKQIEE